MLDVLPARWDHVATRRSDDLAVFVIGTTPDAISLTALEGIGEAHGDS